MFWTCIQWGILSFKQSMQLDEVAIKNHLTLTKWGGLGIALGHQEPRLSGDSPGTATTMPVQLSTIHQCSEDKWEKSTGMYRRPICLTHRPVRINLLLSTPAETCSCSCYLQTCHTIIWFSGRVVAWRTVILAICSHNSSKWSVSAIRLTSPLKRLFGADCLYVTLHTPPNSAVS